MVNLFLSGSRKTAYIRWLKVKQKSSGGKRATRTMIVLDSNNWVGRRFFFRISSYKFGDVLMRPKLGVVSSINENLKDPRFVRVPGKANRVNVFQR